MALAKISDAELLAAVRAAGNVRDAARALGMARSSIGERFKRLTETVQANDTEVAFASERGLLGTEPVLPGYAIKRTTAVYKEGEVVREYVTQAKAPGRRGEIPAGHVVKGVSQLRDATGRVMQEWVKTREADGDPALFAKALRDVMLDARGPSGIVLPEVDRDDDLLTVYVVSDLHLGMMAHGAECGED